MNLTVHSEPEAPVHELDVRPILAAGGAPLGAILQAVANLPPGVGLRLLAPFEPVPLYARLAAAGFVATSHKRDDATWEILFLPQRKAAPDPVLLDLRQLEPPEPMQRALEALATILPGGVLIIVTRFRPVHLLSILDQRGVTWETSETSDGGWETFITVPA